MNGCVAVCDLEMSTQLFDWLGDQRIRRDDRLIVIPMRGQASTFNILDDEIRSLWARRFKAAGVVYLIVDCLRPVGDALELDEHREYGRLLVAFDQLCAEAGITEAMVVHHMGHGGERARGDSRLRDWPDVEWRLVRQDDDPGSPRFFTAYGRDVDVPESQLEFEPQTRRLTIAGGSRRDVASSAALAAVVSALEAEARPMSGRAIKGALVDSEHPRAAIEQALRLGVQNGALIVRTGPRNARLYEVGVPVSRSVPRVSRTGSVQCPASLIERDAGTHVGGELTVPNNGGGDADEF